MQSLDDLDIKQLESLIAEQEALISAGSELDALSVEDLEALIGEREAEKGFGDRLLDGAIEVGQAIDSVTGAPTRAAINAAQNAENPISAFVDQFGEDPSLAASGKDIAQKTGFPETSLSDLFPNLYTDDSKKADEWLTFKKGGPADISASGAAGLAYDIALDPTALAGGAAIKGLQVTGKGLKNAKIAKNIVDSTPVSLARNVGESLHQNVSEAGQVLSRSLSPKRSPNYERLVEIANRNKIKPDELPYAVEFGKNSFPSKMQRFKAEGPLGEPVLNKMDDAFRQVDNALEEKIIGFSGEVPKGEQYGGTLIREGFDEAVDKLSKASDITFSNIHKRVPGIKLSESANNSLNIKLNGIEKWAKGKLQRGIRGESLEEAKHMLSVVKAVRNNNGSVKQVVEAMQDIGQLAFNSKNYLDRTPKDIKKLREIYFAISDGVFDTIKTHPKLGTDVANSLKETNQVFKRFFDDKAFVNQIGARRISDEALFNNLIKNGDSNQIGALKRLMSPEKLQQLKGEFLGSLIKRNIDGEISYKQLSNALARKKGALGLFSKDEIQGVNELIELHHGMGHRVLSHSGTGATNNFRDLLRSPVDALLSNSAGDALVNRHIQKARKTPSSPKPKKSNTSLKPLIQNKNFSKQIERVAAFSPVVARLISSQGETIKGREKWVVNGIDNVLKHNSNALKPKQLEKLYKSNKGKEFLVAASDLKSNSKAMKNLIGKIQTFLKE